VLVDLLNYKSTKKNNWLRKLQIRSSQKNMWSAKLKSANCHICGWSANLKKFKSANWRICDLRNFFADRPHLQQKNALKKKTLKHGVKSIGQTARGWLCHIKRWWEEISIQQWKVIIIQSTDKNKTKYL
jgi:hypothetical protein